MSLDLRTIIWFLCVLGIFSTFVLRPRIGAYLYLVGALFAPVTILNFSFVRIELVLVPLMFVAVFLRKGFCWSDALLPAVAWAAWVLAVSLGSQDEVNWIGCYAFVRLVALSMIFASIGWTERDVIRSQSLFCLTAIPMALLCLGQVLSLPGARGLTESAYTTPSANVFDRQIVSEREGYAFRAIGTFGNVSPTGAYFVLVTGIGMVLLAEAGKVRRGRRRRGVVACLAAGFVGGIATMSGTYVAGAVPAIATAVLLSPRQSRRFSLAVVGVAAVCLVAVAWLAVRYSETFSDQLRYQWDRFTSGRIVESRYVGNDAVLAEALEDVSEAPLCGHGVIVNDTFIGDSVYMTLLYSSGLLGSSMLLLSVGMLAIHSLRWGLAGRLALMWTILIFVCGVGSTGIFILRFGDWWWATQGMLAGLLRASPTPGRNANAIRLPAGFAVGAEAPRISVSGGARASSIR